MNATQKLEDNFVPITLGTLAVTAGTTVALYARHLAKIAKTYQSTSEEIVKLIATKSPEDLIKFTNALYLGK